MTIFLIVGVWAINRLCNASAASVMPPWLRLGTLGLSVGLKVLRMTVDNYDWISAMLAILHFCTARSRAISSFASVILIMSPARHANKPKRWVKQAAEFFWRQGFIRKVRATAITR